MDGDGECVTCNLRFREPFVVHGLHQLRSTPINNSHQRKLRDVISDLRSALSDFVRITHHGLQKNHRQLARRPSFITITHQRSGSVKTSDLSARSF